MIPIIGSMVGAYIITRTTAMVTQNDVNTVAKVFAVLTALISVLGIFALIASSSDVSRNIGPLLR